MRELIISQIKDSGWLDWVWPDDGTSYEEWLHTLNDNDLLNTFWRVSIAESNLD